MMEDGAPEAAVDDDSSVWMAPEPDAMDFLDVDADSEPWLTEDQLYELQMSRDVSLNVPPPLNKWDEREPTGKIQVTVSKARRVVWGLAKDCLLYTSPSPRDQRGSRMPSSA